MDSENGQTVNASAVDDPFGFTLDKLNVERTQLRSEKQAMAAQLSLAAASPRIQSLARREGLVPADPIQTTYVRIRPGSR